MNDNLEQLLSNLKLTKIREIIERELKRATKQEPSYEAFLARLLRFEFKHKQERAIANRIKRARLPETWTLETFPFKKQTSVKARAMRQLAELEFVAKAQNIVFIGEPGVGKSGLATSLLLKACENGYRGLFIKAQNLFDDMFASLADRSTRSLLNRLRNIDLIVIDEMGYLNLRPEQSNIFFKLMDERYGRKSTIITTNLEYDDWYSFLGKKDMVKALLDRLRHHCHTVRIIGDSLRDPEFE